MANEKELICIMCPNGCRLKVDENMNVTGNRCPRGVKYAIDELTNPVRVVTSTARISSSILPVIPVKTSSPVPKGKIHEVMEEINKLRLKPPVKMGQVLIEDVAGTGVSVIATRSLAK